MDLSESGLESLVKKRTFRGKIERLESLEKATFTAKEHEIPHFFKEEVMIRVIKSNDLSIHYCSFNPLAFLAGRERREQRMLEVSSQMSVFSAEIILMFSHVLV